MAEIKLGKLVNEGKTKKVYDVVDDHDVYYIESKDRITAGDGAKAHDFEGKGALSNDTNAKVFKLLNKVGIKTAFLKTVNEKGFLAKKCEMLPIEWVIRRKATGSFIRRNEGVPEGYRFHPPLLETFYKNDMAHDPQWSKEQIISARFVYNDTVIGMNEYNIMSRTAITVFEILERAWCTRDCDLIDMKIEFGIAGKGEIVVADVIDNDSWRLWPEGKKELMKDKEVYRNLTDVTPSDLETVKLNFKWVVDQLEFLISPIPADVIIFMASESDKCHSETIANHARGLGLQSQLRVCSAHKSTEETLRILAEYEGSGKKVVLVAVAGRSNGLGPVLSGNTIFPVINCAPGSPADQVHDIWSSLNVPSGLGCTTVLYAQAAALAAAQIHALHNHIIWGHLRVNQLENFIRLTHSDKTIKQNFP